MLWLTPANGTLYAIQLPLLDGQPGFVWHQVAGVEVRHGNRTTIFTMAGAVLTVTPQGIQINSTGLPGGASELEAAAPAAGPGRRLFAYDPKVYWVDWVGNPTPEVPPPLAYVT